MDLRRVWVIVRSGSQTAQRIASRCCEQLEARGCAVICATSGLTTNPYPGLLADDRLPDLVLVLGAMAQFSVLPGIWRHWMCRS